MNQTLIKEKIKNLNMDYYHPSYSLEKMLVEEITYGHESKAHAILDDFNSKELPNYSEDKVRSKRISLVAWSTVFYTAAIDAGVSYEAAVDLRNKSIIHIDELKDTKPLSNYEYTMVSDFINLINRERFSIYPYPVKNIAKYIYSHIEDKMTVTDIADNFNFSSDYISKLFKKDTGISMSKFIQYYKIQHSKNTLKFTSTSIQDISDSLGFSNQSHFTRVFKNHEGISPFQYRLSIHGTNGFWDLTLEN